MKYALFSLQNYNAIDHIHWLSYNHFVCFFPLKKPVIHYLVKWCSLPYEDSTWELKQDIDQAKIEEYEKLVAREPETERVVRFSFLLKMFLNSSLIMWFVETTNMICCIWNRNDLLLMTGRNQNVPENIKTTTNSGNTSWKE